MNKTALLLCIATLAIFSNCNKTENKYDKPQKITVTGKIDNYDPNRQVTLSVFRIGLGLPRESIVANTDSTGNFIATFESYIPVDAWIVYKTGFSVLLHPNDSLFVHFDGKYDDKVELLKFLNFSGDASKTNQYAVKFQQMYSDQFSFDWNKHQKAMKEYDTNQYIQYLDTVLQQQKKIYDQFVAENRPDDESKRWAHLFIEDFYYQNFCSYANNHRRLNNMGNDIIWDVPKGFYDVLCNRLPIAESMFISAQVLSGFPVMFGNYVDYKLKDKDPDLWRIHPEDSRIFRSGINYDSLRIFSAIEFLPDPLLSQISLAQFFDNKFRFQDIVAYEQFRDLVDAHITEPFLKEPLEQKYFQVKQRIENPQVPTEAILKKTADFSASQIMDNIVQQNKGKVIYVDFWATWCSPCLQQMPNSQIIEHEFVGKDVVFVYVCLQSDEKQWKATLDRFQLGGQHYLLSNKQSNEIRNLLKIPGEPFYLLIDKNGVIKERGNDLRPLVARDKIKEMLK